MKPQNELTWDSIITEFCFFLLWGLFIGYTVAMEYTDERKREPEKRRSTSRKKASQSGNGCVKIADGYLQRGWSSYETNCCDQWPEPKHARCT